MRFQQYRTDRFGKICLKLSSNSKADMRFGAILIKGGKIIGRGWNRLADDADRALMRKLHVDYASHAEQSAIIDALKRGFDPTGAKLYVLGEASRGKNKGKLSARRAHFFGCVKCPHALIKYDITVHIPTTCGWVGMSGQRALKTALKKKGHWTKLLNGEKV